MASQPKSSSSAVSSSVAAKTSSTVPASSVAARISASMPPPPMGPVKIVDVTHKKQSAVFQGSKVSTASASHVTSNSEASILQSQMKCYMDQQNLINQRILRELDEIKKAKAPAEDPSPLHPKALDFSSPTTTAAQNQGSSFQYQGSFLQHQGSSSHPPGRSIFDLGSTGLNQSGSLNQNPSGYSVVSQGSSMFNQDPWGPSPHIQGSSFQSTSKSLNHTVAGSLSQTLPGPPPYP